MGNQKSQEVKRTRFRCPLELMSLMSHQKPLLSVIVFRDPDHCRSHQCRGSLWQRARERVINHSPLCNVFSLKVIPVSTSHIPVPQISQMAIPNPREGSPYIITPCLVGTASIEGTTCTFQFVFISHQFVLTSISLIRIL